MTTKWHGVLAGVVMLAFATNSVHATEGGGSARALGVDTVMAGVMPPPGLRVTLFVPYYHANHTLDSSGNDRAGLTNFNFHAEGAIPRLSYVWSGAQLWGADIETRVALGYFDAKVHFDVQTPNGPIHRESSASGLADPLVAPVVLGWHGERVHQMTGLYFFLPIGNFDANRLVNTSRGYYTVAPVYWITWFPNDAIEVSGNLSYLFNFKNHDTHYTSGNEVALDYGLGYAATDAWQIGVSGFAYKQMTNDNLNGRVVGDGNKGQAVGVGPFIRYHPSPDWGITFKWQYETLVENRAQGYRFLLQMMYKLW